MSEQARDLGGQLAIICGEITSLDTRYMSNGDCCCKITVTTQKARKKQDGTPFIKYIKNRCVIWKKAGEEFAKRATARDFKANTDGSIVILLCYEYGEQQDRNDKSKHWHEFTVSRFRILKDRSEWDSIMEQNQDPSVIPVYSILGIDR